MHNTNGTLSTSIDSYQPANAKLKLPSVDELFGSDETPSFMMVGAKRKVSRSGTWGFKVPSGTSYFSKPASEINPSKYT